MEPDPDAEAAPQELARSVKDRDGQRVHLVEQGVRPVGLEQRILDGQTGGQRVHGRVKRNHKRVALGLDLVARVRDEDLADNLVVEDQRVAHDFGVRLPQRRRALDVGKHEGQLALGRRDAQGRGRSGARPSLLLDLELGVERLELFGQRLRPLHGQPELVFLLGLLLLDLFHKGPRLSPDLGRLGTLLAQPPPERLFFSPPVVHQLLQLLDPSQQRAGLGPSIVQLELERLVLRRHQAVFGFRLLHGCLQLANPRPERGQFGHQGIGLMGRTRAGPQLGRREITHQRRRAKRACRLSCSVPAGKELGQIQLHGVLFLALHKGKRLENLAGDVDGGLDPGGDADKVGCRLFGAELSRLDRQDGRQQLGQCITVFPPLSKPLRDGRAFRERLFHTIPQNLAHLGPGRDTRRALVHGRTSGFGNKQRKVKEKQHSTLVGLALEQMADRTRHPESRSFQNVKAHGHHLDRILLTPFSLRVGIRILPCRLVRQPRKHLQHVLVQRRDPLHTHTRQHVGSTKIWE